MVPRRSRDVPTANNTTTSLLYCSHVFGQDSARSCSQLSIAPLLLLVHDAASGRRPISGNVDQLSGVIVASFRQE